MKKFLRENALSVVLFVLFFVFLIGLSITGCIHENEEAALHNQSSVSYVEYITSGTFTEAVFENWESEFLQMGALVVLTIWLVQKGSADSKKLRGKDAVDTSSRYSIIHASSWSARKKAIGKALYANSLSLALFGLFFVSLALHAVGGVVAANEELALHNKKTIGVLEYISGPRSFGLNRSKTGKASSWQSAHYWCYRYSCGSVARPSRSRLVNQTKKPAPKKGHLVQMRNHKLEAKSRERPVPFLPAPLR